MGAQAPQPGTSADTPQHVMDPEAGAEAPQAPQPELDAEARATAYLEAALHEAATAGLIISLPPHLSGTAVAGGGVAVAGDGVSLWMCQVSDEVKYTGCYSCHCFAGH